MNKQDQRIELDREQVLRALGFIPRTSQKRMLLLDQIVAELNRRNFKRLDETRHEDLRRVMAIVADMHPESTNRKVREYAEVAIRLWNKQRKA